MLYALLRLHKLLQFKSNDILKLAMDKVKAQIFFTIFSIQLKETKTLKSFGHIINILFTNMKCI